MGQYEGQYQQQQQPQQPQTAYGSYGDPTSYQAVPQPADPYQAAQQPYQPVQPPYAPIQNPGYGPQSVYPGAGPYIPPVAQQGPNGGLAIAGLVLGIVSLVLFWTLYLGIPAAIVGIVLSILGASFTATSHNGYNRIGTLHSCPCFCTLRNWTCNIWAFSFLILIFHLQDAPDRNIFLSGASLRYGLLIIGLSAG